MKNNLQRKVINVDKSNLIPLWTVKELDDCILKLSLFKNNVAFDVTGQTLSLGAKTPIGLQEQSSGITFNSNEVDIQLKNSIVAKKGIVEIDLNIKDASGSMTTASFFIVVGEKVLNDAGVEASEQFDSLTQLIKECEDVLQNGGAVNIVDNLTSTSTTSALSAKQGNVLNDSISDIKNEIDAARGSNQFLGDRLDCIDSTIDNMVIEYSDESISVEFPSLINDINTIRDQYNTIAEKQDELFQSVSNGKKMIASAITDMGVSTLATDTFEVMANNIRNITAIPDVGDTIVLETGEFLVGYDNGVIQEPETGGGEVTKDNYIDVTQEPNATSSFTNWSSSGANSMTITTGAYRTRYVSYVIELPTNSNFTFSCNYSVTTGNCNVRIFDASGNILAQTGFTNGSTGSGQYNLSFSSTSDNGSYTVYFYATDNSGTYEEANVTFSEVKIEKVV